ncbi:MAG: ABC transporter permease [Gemmatimonadaceae bacterium]|nr:ABC transporter permease [Gemmatimonadaceae bacterium]
MQRILRRGAESLVLFWLVVSLTFLLTRLAPGDPTDLLVPPTARAEDIARLRAAYGLDAGLAGQYARWTTQVLSGDLGLSFATQEPVRDVIRRALPITLALGVTSLALTFLLGVSVGLWQARRADTTADRIATTISIAIFAAPSFWMALALVALFTSGATHFGWPAWLRLPAMGLETPGSEWRGWARASDIARHAVLPVTVLTAIGAAGLARYARAAALDLLASDWVRTARAKGLGASAVMRRHVLANARPPLITLLALSLPGTVAGSVFVESVFAWPGMGRTMLASIAARDYPVVMGAALVYAALVIASNWLADVAVAWADPRRRDA